MSTWGSGLYSGDFAVDLRSAVAAVLRLPYEPDRLVEILCETEPAAAHDAANEDHSAFWLVVADQFAKRGIVSERAREQACRIIDGDADIAMLQKLQMSESGIRKRRKQLEEIRARITAPSAPKARAVLKQPQALLLEVGDVIVYPTRRGHPFNPYFATARVENGRPWIPDSWGAAVIIERGRAFGFLSWYRPLTIAKAVGDKPSLAALRGDAGWRLFRAGTCSTAHFKRMELEKIGNLAIDPAKLASVLPPLSSAVSDAVSDISIANRLRSDPYAEEPTMQWGKLKPIFGLGQILRDEDPAAR
jgi:hypothetical protein